MTIVRAFLLREHPSNQYTTLISYQVKEQGVGSVTALEQEAMERIKSHKNFKTLTFLEVPPPQIYQVRVVVWYSRCLDLYLGLPVFGTAPREEVVPGRIHCWPWRVGDAEFPTPS